MGASARISGIRAHVLRPTEPIYRWRVTMEPRSMQFILLRILSDSGHEGHCMSWMMLTPGEVTDAIAGLRAKLTGRDPHEVEAISHELTFGLERPTRIASHIDVALWDLIGKLHGVPLYRLFGAARERLPVYADSVFFSDTAEAYVEVAQEARRQGFLGIKLHPACVPENDITVCAAVREAMGDDFVLLVDSHNYFNRSDALRVGRVLEKLSYRWFEAPILDSDIQGLSSLSRALAIAVAGTESVVQGLRAYPLYLLSDACIVLRGFGDVIGGISALRKAAALCEAFNIKFEPHSYGSPHMVNAHLHVMLSTHACEWVELPMPQDAYEIGCRPGVRVQKDGYVYAPTGPGLGCEIDFDEIDRLTIEEI